ncbi:MAG: hypothetical protein FWG57_07055 [Endomicrobia bacterium]|nr:hypothetical protein [Endomicrobiia bacterium]
MKKIVWLTIFFCLFIAACASAPKSLKSDNEISEDIKPAAIPKDAKEIISKPSKIIEIN